MAGVGRRPVARERAGASPFAEIGGLNMTGPTDLEATVPHPHDSRLSFETFLSTLDQLGLRESLAYLVGLTDYRFIGLWRFENGKANAAVHYDRENPAVMHAQEVPDTATYCCYVRDSKGVFMTAHAMLDPRTESHPARGVLPSYCGVPVMDDRGHIVATLCHYDVVPRDPSQVDLELMVQVASTLAQRGLVPPYPVATPN